MTSITEKEYSLPKVIHRKTNLSATKREGSGFSLLEVVLGVFFFTLLFVGAMKGFTESNLPAQGLIRDSAIALNLCEKILNQIENNVKEGHPEEEIDEDITEQLLEQEEVRDYLARFAGGVRKKGEINFRIHKRLKPIPHADLLGVEITFSWKDANVPHQLKLKGTLCREKSLTIRN
jgi:hypothetical protein